MGMYNSIFVLCPRCGHKNEHQSKAGSCLLKVSIFPLGEPEDIVRICSEKKTHACEDCSKYYIFTVQVLAQIFPIENKIYREDDENND